MDMDSISIKGAIGAVARTAYSGLNRVTVTFRNGRVVTGMVQEVTDDPAVSCSASSRPHPGTRACVHQVDLREIQELRVYVGGREEVYR
jgi:hypothetical protein